MGSPYQYSMALGCDFRSRTGYLFVCCNVFFSFFFSFPFFLFSFYILFYSLLSLSADCQVKYRSVSHHRLYRLSHWLSDTPGRSLITTNITNILVRKCCSSPKISENPHSLNQRVQLACSASLWPPFGGINPSPQSHTRMDESLFFCHLPLHRYHHHHGYIHLPLFCLLPTYLPLLLISITSIPPCCHC